MAARRDTRREILELSGALFVMKGIGATTVRDIGDAAGMHPGSLYHHFRSKDDIVRAIMSNFLLVIDQRFGQAVALSDKPVEQVRALIVETLRVIEDHPHPTAIYRNDRNYLWEHGLMNAVVDDTDRVRRYWLDAIERGVVEGSFRPDISPEVFYRSVSETLWSTVDWNVLGRAEGTTGRLAAELADLFLGGFTQN